MARVRCPICGNVAQRSFRPGTDANSAESYTLTEWMRRGETEKALDHVTETTEAHEADEAAEVLSEDDLSEIEAKARQCQPPHVASTWTLVPPVHEWYAQDVPRLLSELRRMRELVRRRR